jgi:transposase
LATIIKKIKKGRPYYYAVESQRVNGQPRVVWQKYLGTVDAIVKRTAASQPPKPQETVIFEAGGVAALLRIAQRLGLLELINDAVPKREQGPTVGHYLVLAALNRALAPCSKAAIGEWYEQTVLRRLWRFPQADFSSQRFWDHMDLVSEKAIAQIEERLIGAIEQEFGLPGNILLYDTTNFFTFLATTNDRAALPQRGHSKAKRHDLRQVGLALLVDRDFQIPLLHRVYSGNVPDVSLFPQISRELIARYQRLASLSPEATLVFDKGNVSDDALENLVVSGVHFVAALSANRCPELLATPLEGFAELSGMPGSKAFSTAAELWGRHCRVVVVYSESFFTQQLSGVTANLVKCQKKLLDLGKSLERWRRGKGRGKKPTAAAVRKSARGILTPQFMKELLRAEVVEENGLPRLQYAVDHAALRKLADERLGRTMLASDQLPWPAAEIVGAYRSLTQVEEAFKNMKNIHFLHWQPAYHWTDQKIRVHGFYCVLALMLATLARKCALQAEIDLSLPAMLEELSAIREVAVIYPPGTMAHRKDHLALSRMSSRQRKLAEILQLGEVLK